MQTRIPALFLTLLLATFVAADVNAQETALPAPFPTDAEIDAAVQRLAGADLAAATLASVRAYETARRDRRRILTELAGEGEGQPDIRALLAEYRAVDRAEVEALDNIRLTATTHGAGTGCLPPYQACIEAGIGGLQCGGRYVVCLAAELTAS